MKKLFNITGMSCSACSAHIEKAVKDADGIKTVSVNLLRNNMAVEFDETTITPNEIIGIVASAGYGASLPENKETKTKTDDELSLMKRRLILSLIFTVPLFYLSMGHMMGWPLPSVYRHARLGEKRI